MILCENLPTAKVDFSEEKGFGDFKRQNYIFGKISPGTEHKAHLSDRPTQLLCKDKVFNAGTDLSRYLFGVSRLVKTKSSMFRRHWSRLPTQPVPVPR